MVSIFQVWITTVALAAGNITGTIFSGNVEQGFYGTFWLLTLAIVLSVCAALSRASATPEGKR